jgi:hypothetical protein
MQQALSSSTGKLDILSCPGGAHGATMTGMQGIGVSVPMAAAVAEATVGLAIDWHMPNGGILTIGLLSMILPIGNLAGVSVGRVGSNTEKVDGAIPKEHCSIAPRQAILPMVIIRYKSLVGIEGFFCGF